MKDTSLLVRNYIKGQGGFSALFGSKSIKTKWGKVGMAILFLYLALVFGFFFFSSLLQQALTSGEKFIGNVFLYTVAFPFMFLGPFSIALFTSGKDTDMLFSWPVRREDIFKSRMLVMLIYSGAFSLIVYVPMIILSCMLWGFRPLWLLGYTVMHVASVLFCSTLLAAICSKCPKEIMNALSTIISVLMMFLLLRRGMNAMEEFIDNGMVPVVTDPSTFPLLVFAAASLVLSFVLWKVSAGRFGTAGRSLGIGEKGRKAVQKTGTPLKALIRSEWMQIRGDTGLLSEFTIEVIMPLFLIVIYMMMGIAGDLFEMMSSVPLNVRLMMPAFVVGGTCTINLLSASSFSREGRMREVYAALPITRSDRIKSKLLFHIALEVPMIFIATGLFSYLFKTGVVIAVLTAIWALSVTFMTALIGLNIDMRNPYRDWEKRVEALKKNMNTFKAMVLSFALAAVSIVFFVMIELDGILTLILATAVCIVFSLLSAKLLSRAEEAVE